MKSWLQAVAPTILYIYIKKWFRREISWTVTSLLRWSGKQNKQKHFSPSAQWVSFLIWRQRETQILSERETQSWLCAQAKLTESNEYTNYTWSHPICFYKMKACLWKGRTQRQHYLLIAIIGLSFVAEKEVVPAWNLKSEWKNVYSRTHDFWTLKEKNIYFKFII